MYIAQDGSTALILASMSGHAAVVSRLLDLGASKDVHGKVAYNLRKPPIRKYSHVGLSSGGCITTLHSFICRLVL